MAVTCHACPNVIEIIFLIWLWGVAGTLRITFHRCNALDGMERDPKYPIMTLGGIIPGAMLLGAFVTVVRVQESPLV